MELKGNPKKNLTDDHKPILEIYQVYKKMGGRAIIQNLTLNAYSGEVLGLLGPNGAGKTTLIRMIVGLMSTTSGRISIAGHDISREKVKALKHVGTIIENPEMYKFLSGYDNLLHYSRMVRGVDKARIAYLVKLVGLEFRIRDKVKTYSLGMRQRLGVAQALLHNPSLLLLDEPTNGLDPAGIRELRDYLKRLAHEENVAVVVSSHLLSEMELMCDRVAIVQNGSVKDIQKVNHTTVAGAAENIPVVFNIDRPDLAQSAIQAAHPEVDVYEDPAGVRMTAEIEQIPVINECLVAAGVKVYEIRMLAKSLEDKFLEVTNEKQLKLAESGKRG
ncbi:ABC transporter ATP-binding protein [Paenibacillus sp. J2TS4]|uniref:ABC transporter ATP-binding protein n=1 Tax=Paenibacillus sp. J2TS4 TaxID=2807194 RepID=UPI001B048E4E|nr:ABC transporter ATP-binding protein [Paenibacillus sp. J2TS4]GIP36171.1 putative ABC transporter ATP-binding protein YhcH [Paenibacillus sp. J2TS4]